MNIKTIRYWRESSFEGQISEKFYKIGKSSKLAPRYIEPFEILEVINPIAYKMSLPPNLSRMDNFLYCYLKKYILGGNHILNWNALQT